MREFLDLSMERIFCGEKRAQEMLCGMLKDETCRRLKDVYNKMEEITVDDKHSLLRELDDIKLDTDSPFFFKYLGEKEVMKRKLKA